MSSLAAHDPTLLTDNRRTRRHWLAQLKRGAYSPFLRRRVLLGELGWRLLREGLERPWEPQKQVALAERYGVTQGAVSKAARRLKLMGLAWVETKLGWNGSTKLRTRPGVVNDPPDPDEGPVTTIPPRTLIQKLSNAMGLPWNRTEEVERSGTNVWGILDGGVA